MAEDSLSFAAVGGLIETMVPAAAAAELPENQWAAVASGPCQSLLAEA